MSVHSNDNSILKACGTLTHFEFGFKVFKDEDLIVSLMDPGTQDLTPLKLNVDYTVSINRIGDGGSIELNETHNGYSLYAYREIEIIQPHEVPTEGYFPESTIENALDRGIMIDQQLQERINRCIAIPGTSGFSGVNVQLPVPKAGNTLAWSEDETHLENFDVKGANNDFKADVNTTLANARSEFTTQITNFSNDVNSEISQFESSTNTQINNFKNEINTQITEVSEAAAKIKELDGAVQMAVKKADVASNAAEIATSKANEATEIIENSLADIESKTQEEINKIKQTGFYMQEDKLYYIDSNGETKEFKSDSELNNPYVLFDNKYVEAPLYNLSWLKSDGEYKPKARYPKAYEALVVENNSSIAVGTTVDLPSGTKYTKRGLSVKLSTDESATDYDFRINTTDESFRLPLKNGQEGVFASGVKGNGLTMGLTNGSDYVGLTSGQNGVLVGKLNMYGTNIGTSWIDDSPITTKSIGLTTDPTKSGMVVDKTVPSGYNLYYYVGETVQNANLIDAGRIAEELANKQDKCIHIIDTYVNGTSGYIIWSNGYCEQWGHTIKDYATITFLKRFINTNYQVYITPNGTPSVANISPCIISKSNIGAKIYTDLKGGENGTDWKASGYIR